MRVVWFKKLKVNKTTSQITLEHISSESTKAVEIQMRAISILLGGYNVFGRSIDLEKHEERLIRFCDLLEEIEADL